MLKQLNTTLSLGPLDESCTNGLHGVISKSLDTLAVSSMASSEAMEMIPQGWEKVDTVMAFPICIKKSFSFHKLVGNSARNQSFLRRGKVD